MEQPTNRGVKRKRYEPPEEELSVRIGGKLHHEIKEVHKASKRAKMLETQKVVKRLKDLRKKDETDKSIGEFESELMSLKEVNHDAVGNSALKTKILKDHTLKENEDVKAAISKEFADNFLVPAEPGSNLAKIQSRLLSSKILATQIAASLESLKILLNPALKQRDNNIASKEEGEVDTSPTSTRPAKLLKTSGLGDFPNKSKLQKREAPNEEEDDGEERLSEPESEVSSRDDAGWELDSVGGDGGAGPLEDDGWESGSIGGAGSPDEDEDEDSDESDSESDDQELMVRPPAKQPKPVAKTAMGSASKKMESTFLPSLSVGFVRGADDSDFSDAEGLDADLPKKNRRGQRARRAIWEKKFGRNANHKKKEAALMATLPPNTKQGGHTSKIRSGANAIASNTLPSAPAQGSSSSSRGKAGAQSQGGVDAGWGKRSAGVPAVRAAKPGPTRADKNSGDKPLHPSWEAKRRLKEKESAGIIPSQGTKIKFA